MKRVGEPLLRIRRQLGRTVYRATIAGRIATGSHRALTRDEARALLTEHGCPATDPVLDFEETFGGLEVCGLRLGLGATQHLWQQGSQIRCAVPIGTGPSDVVFWMDAAGGVYDDTDLECCVPIGASARGLLRYWLFGIRKNRWSGVVHDYIAQLEGFNAEGLAAVLDTRAGGRAFGGSVAVWSAEATRVCDTIDQARIGFAQHATLSAPNVTTFVDALRIAADARPDLRIQLTQPSLPSAQRAVTSSLLRIPCLHNTRPALDGFLAVVPDETGYTLVLEATPRS